MKIHEHDFETQEVILDYHEFSHCSFKNCKMIFHGHGKFTIQNCTFDSCTWVVERPALHLVDFHKWCRSQKDAGFDAVADDILRLFDR